MASSAVKRIMMCRPSHFKVNYSINPWMKENNPVDTKKAMKQWKKLKTTINDTEIAQVVVMESDDAPNFPDIVFCANAGIVRGNHVFLSHFAHPERYGEFHYYDKFFKKHGFITFFNKRIAHEGTGDALWFSKHMNTLLTGVGPRSDILAIDSIHRKLRRNEEDNFQIVAARLVDPRFYHLDTCFCPLNENLALWYPHAFDPVTQNNIKNYTNVIPVSECDAARFACNAVVVGNDVILNEGSDDTMKLLEQHGFKPHPVDMSEFIKAGGSAKCCTLKLDS